MTMDRNAGATVPESVSEEEGYKRGLSPRTIQMIAIGGAIGTGLFYGAGGAIEQAGPALILCYLAAGAAIFVIMRALGELLTYRPVSGSFAEYADEFRAGSRDSSPAGRTGRSGGGDLHGRDHRGR